eukprot:TRINITY_DN386_c0_g1_i1.p1 TRINITY_DN386_c0_g1~~TRINITY_DN386_c0_g1_i1.p1  ORF type:complete len:232 (+),score=38.42 TRINITY_DN386_c0_g1_i1:82-696(+)
MSYSRGVLIHNYNEDRFGVDLQSIQRVVPGPTASVSHTVHNWKTPAEQAKGEASVQALERHVLFGHTGDMRDPHTNLQKSEYATANQYFMKDPATIAGVGTLTADGYTVGEGALTMIGKVGNHKVAKMKANWGDMRQTHALPPSDRFQTETKRSFNGEQQLAGGERQFDRIPRTYDEFTRQYDSVQLRRSTGSNLRSAASLMVR